MRKMLVFQGTELFVSSLMLLEGIILTLKQETPHLNKVILYSLLYP